MLSLRTRKRPEPWNRPGTAEDDDGPDPLAVPPGSEGGISGEREGIGPPAVAADPKAPAPTRGGGAAKTGSGGVAAAAAAAAAAIPTPKVGPIPAPDHMLLTGSAAELQAELRPDSEKETWTDLGIEKECGAATATATGAATILPIPGQWRGKSSATTPSVPPTRPPRA